MIFDLKLLAYLLPAYGLLLFALRDGWGGKEEGRWRTFLRGLTIFGWRIGAGLEQFWRNPGDRLLTAGTLFGLGAAANGAGWWALLIAVMRAASSLAADSCSARKIWLLK